jgi:integrase
METKPKRPAIWTARQLETLQPEREPYAVKHKTETGLWVLVRPSGVKSWQLFFQWKGKQAKLVLGEMSIAEAKLAAGKARTALDEGLDPREGKRVAKAILKRKRSVPTKTESRPAGKAPSARPESPEDADAGSVPAVVAAYVDGHAKPNKRTWRESARLLDKDFVPVFADRRFADLTADDFQSCVDAVADRGAPVLANRLYAELSKLCKWAASRRVRLIPSNPFRDIEKPLTSERSRRRQRVLSDAELALVWQATDALRFPWSQIVKLLILTGQRRTEVASMNWGELDLTNAVWNLPPARTKNKQAHAVPLAPAAVAILRAVPRFARRPAQTDFCFGLTPPRSFSDAKKALDKAVTRLNGGAPLAPWTLHDLRRSFVTGAARLRVDLAVIERAVNHTSGTFAGIVGVYQTHKFEPEVRAAMERWAAHVAGLAAPVARESENALAQ